MLVASRSLWLLHARGSVSNFTDVMGAAGMFARKDSKSDDIKKRAGAVKPRLFCLSSAP